MTSRVESRNVTPSDRPGSMGALPAEASLIAKRLAHALRAQAVYLFGSHARGEAGPDSDLDFLVIVHESSASRYVRGIEARRAVRDIFVPKDIVVLTRDEWDAERPVACSLASTVEREGIKLHG